MELETMPAQKLAHKVAYGKAKPSFNEISEEHLFVGRGRGTSSSPGKCLYEKCWGGWSPPPPPAASRSSSIVWDTMEPFHSLVIGGNKEGARRRRGHKQRGEA
jgi:hypothetical protein